MAFFPSVDRVPEGFVISSFRCNIQFRWRLASPAGSYGLKRCVSEMSVRWSYVAPMRYILCCLLMMLSGQAIASNDHESARAAVQDHKVMPLSEIVPSVLEKFGARLLEAEFERKHGTYVYELELITNSGRMIEVLVDAATGEILRSDREGGEERED